MIRVSGTTEGPEADAAPALPHPSVLALGGARQPRHRGGGSWCAVPRAIDGRDLDVVLFATFPSRARFIPFLNFQRRGDHRWVRPAEVRVTSLCLILEVKDNDQADVRFEGTRLEVRYRHDGVEHWHGASEQSHKQVFALLNYLAGHHLEAPFITNVVGSARCQTHSTAPAAVDILGGRYPLGTPAERGIAAESPVRAGRRVGAEGVAGGTAAEHSPDHPGADPAATYPAGQPPRMARLRVRPSMRTGWPILAAEQIVLRGRGGTGKR